MDMEADMARFVKNFSLVALGATALSTPAFARDVDVTPYLEVGQVVTADVKGGDSDVLTYSTVAAGVDATVVTQRAELQVSYRYERRFDYQKAVGDDDVHTGLARGRFDIVPNTLSFETGALATRARSDIRGAAPVQGSGNVSNLTQVYSAYAGPSFATRAGPVDVAAAYRFGYTKAEAGSSGTLAPGQQPLDIYDDSMSHYATASVGMEPGAMPFGWVVSGAYERETAGQLKQRYEGKNVRGDVTLPLTPSISLVGGVGYENVEISQRAPQIDAVTGAPVVDAKGRYVTDPASPRLLAYDFDGIYWDTGVVWKPSARTMLEARVGRRYGTMSYTGSFTWETGENSGVQLAAYDEVETFGQQLNDNLAQMPINFRAARSNQLSNNFGGCVFGGSLGGGCMSDSFQSVNTSAYRSRGAVAIYSARRGRWNMGAGVGYNQRKFLSPTTPGVITVDGVKDQSWFGQANIEYALSDRTSVAGDFFTSYYDPGLAGAGNVLSSGMTGSLFHNFGQSLSASLTSGIYSQKIEDLESQITVSAAAGLRYSF